MRDQTKSASSKTRYGLALAAAGLMLVGLGCARKPGPGTEPVNAVPAVVAPGSDARFALPDDKRAAFATALVSEVPNLVGDASVQEVYGASDAAEREFALASLGEQSVEGRAIWLQYGGYVIVDLDLEPMSLASGAAYDAWVYKSWSGREKLKLGSLAAGQDGRWKLRFAALDWQMRTYDSIVIVDAAGKHVIEGRLAPAE